MNRSLAFALCVFALAVAAGRPCFGQAARGGAPAALDAGLADSFAALALKCVEKEYPNKLDHVMNDGGEVQAPAALHPAFYGCFDWHSSVHGHWMLVYLVKRFPDIPHAAEIRRVLAANLTEARLAAELLYLGGKNRKSFERTYGWAWLLKLAAELQDWDDPLGRALARNLSPLAQAFAALYRDFLPRQKYPIRTGVHPNTAFGIACALDYARTVGDTELEKLLVERSLAYYGRDAGYDAKWEPGGEDFFSPALMEADLMRRVLPAPAFSRWLHAFLPGLKKGRPFSLFGPAVVTDRSDPKIVHLDGLNLSRAWCMAGIAAALPGRDPAAARLRRAADVHALAGLAHVASGNYEGEHWLASFAVVALSTLESTGRK